MNAFDFANKHPILTFLLADVVVLNGHRLINNLAICKTISKMSYDESYEEVTSDPAEVNIECSNT